VIVKVSAEGKGGRTGTKPNQGGVENFQKGGRGEWKNCPRGGAEQSWRINGRETNLNCKGLWKPKTRSRTKRDTSIEFRGKSFFAKEDFGGVIVSMWRNDCSLGKSPRSGIFEKKGRNPSPEEQKMGLLGASSLYLWLA